MADEPRTGTENDNPVNEKTNAENDSGTDLSKIDSVEKLPKWAQDELKRARQEAANYRTRLNGAKDEVRSEIETEYKTKTDELQNKLTDLQAKAETAQLAQMKIDAALEVGVPGEHLKDFAERLNGTTLDELKADATKAKSIFGIGTSKATDPTAGLGGNGPKQSPEDVLGSFVKNRLGWR